MKEHPIESPERFDASFRIAAEINGSVTLSDTDDGSTLVLQGTSRSVEISVEAVRTDRGFPKERVILLGTTVSRIPKETYKALLNLIREADLVGPTPSRTTWMDMAINGGYLVGKNIVSTDVFHQQSRAISTEIWDVMSMFLNNWAWKLGGHLRYPALRRIGPTELQLEEYDWRAVRFLSPSSTSVGYSILPIGSLGLYNGHQDEFRQPIPIHFETFAEAQSLIDSNPRLALVGLVTSIETATKDCIRRLAPETDWIISELQSPPLKRLVHEYIPQLVDSQLDRPMSTMLLSVVNNNLDLRDRLSSMVEKRNALVHGRSVTIRKNSLEGYFEYCHKLLWAFEEIKGNEYAVDRFIENPRQFNELNTTENHLGSHLEHS